MSLPLPKTKLTYSDNYLVSLDEQLVSGNILLVTSEGFRRRGLVECILEQCWDRRILVLDKVKPNPELADLRQWIEQYQSESITQIVALGGGSVIDTAKVMAYSLANLDIILESSLHNASIPNVTFLPLIVIPTTSGTGAEVTPFATVWDRIKQKKLSLTGVTPTVAILDANLTLSLPLEETLYPALDAMSHALESLWNKNRTVESEEHAIQAIECICAALPQVLECPQNLAARKTLQSAATYAGLAISQTKTAIAHAISYPLTIKYGVPHGLACSFTLAAILQKIGGDKLNLSGALVDKVLELLARLSLDNEITKFVDWQILIEQFDPNLDPARANNFIVSFDPGWLTNIILQSRRNGSVGEINEN